jgi:hypothetical protein
VSDGDEPPLTSELALSCTAHPRSLHRLVELRRCPATLTENQLREYFLFLRQHKHYKSAPMKAAKYALLSFFR